MPQSLANLLVHLIFSTKDRQPFLRDPKLLAEVHRYLGGLVKQLGGEALAVGGVADHVHLLLVLPKTMSVSEVVRELKRASSLWIKPRQSGPQDFTWQGGYGAFSVGQGEVEVVRSYILNQEERHRTKTFQEEFRQLLDKYRIPYDERYLWD